MTYASSHHKNERQLSGNNFWSSTSGNQGITWIYELITDQLTAILGKNMTYKRQNMDSKIVDIAHCKKAK